MSNGLNVFTATGNLGGDAKVAHTNSGAAVCNFNLAVKSGWGEYEKTNWIRCKLWGKQAEGKLPSYLTKGKGVAVSGELSIDKHEKEDGRTFFNVELDVKSLAFMGGGDDKPTQYTPSEQPAPAQAEPDVDPLEDEIPF